MRENRKASCQLTITNTNIFVCDVIFPQERKKYHSNVEHWNEEKEKL